MLKSSEKAGKMQEAVGRLFSAVPLSPNQWTLLSLLLAFVAAYFIYQQQLLYAAAAFAVCALLDAVDGAVARATGKATAFGAFFDGIADRVAEAAVLLALFFFNFQQPYAYLAIALLLFLGTCMTAFVRAYAHHRNAVNEDDLKKMGGFFERTERAVLIFFMLLAGSFNSDWLLYLVYLGIVLSAITVLQRFFYVYSRRQ
ncbi:MAG: CDP-alcohol phosphatidyltransferase family protein [Candidatus Micrarchaeota archaeon]